MPAPLFLIGFMAAGKTSVGRALAEATGRRFVDLDDVIAEAGEPVAALVARDEADFRRLEAAALARVIDDAGDGPVVATGGGCAGHGDNLARMKQAGLVVALGVDVADAQARAAGGPPRPLLASADALAARRAPIYRRAHAVVDTTGKSIGDVVRDVAHVERAWQRLPLPYRDATLIALGDRTYPIVVHEGAVDRELVRAYATGTTQVITDTNVAQYADHGAIAIEPGEPSKSFATYQRLCDELIERGLDRTSTIVALGGGVVGDLAGFVAATLYRGIGVIQLPTTLVAMTDAAIGGKTAVDVPAGKNLVGAFHQPRLVACGLATLASLPDRERRAGFGELWKYALLDGPELWALVDACAAWSANGGPRPASLGEVIQRSIAYKAAIVGRDEREQTGHRALLNLGHTIGHAIESASGLHHGEAVGLGLIAAARVSAAVLGIPGVEAEITQALRRSGLPADLRGFLRDDVLARVRVDKKRVGDKVRFIVIREVGRCETAEIAITELGRILRPVPGA
jgi:shikimate kinase/3-dehydroquinate synthase